MSETIPHAQSVLGDMQPSKAIVKLVIPATLALLAKAVYNIVDTAYIGMLRSDIALTAVGVTIPLLLIMVSIENIFAAGAAVLAGRQLGAKDNEGASRTVTTVILLSIMIGVALCVGGISVATVYLGLDCTAEELGMEDYTIFIMGNADPRVQNDTRAEDGMYIVNCLNNVVPDSSPEGTRTLFFTIPVYGSDVPQDLKPEDYKKYKNRIAKKCIEDAEKVLGISITPHIEEISVATPVTFARYLGTPEGTIYGYKLSRWDNLMARIAGEKTDYVIPGLSFCGGHYIRGDGYSCAYIMGETIGKRVAKRIKGGA